MDRALNTAMRRIDGAIDAAKFARHPIFYFDLAPILERSGAYIHNPDRLQVICQHGLGQLDISDLTLFDERGFYLIVGSCWGAAAEGLANRINVALLKLFFGTESLSPSQLIPLFRKASPGEIPGEQRRTPAERATPSPAKPIDGQQRHCIVEQERDVPTSPDLARLAEDGVFAKDHVSLCFMPAYDLRRGTPAIFFCQPTANNNGHIVQGRAAFKSVAAHDLPSIDEAVLRHAVQFADRLMESGNLIAVTAPLSVETLSWSRGRALYQRALREIGIDGHPQVIPILHDVAPGTPVIRVAEMIASLRPFARRVAVALPDGDADLESSGMIGASGFVLAQPRRVDGATAGRQATWLNRICATQGAFSCITGIGSEENLDAVKAAGIRFGAGTALAPPALTGENAIEYARLLARLPPLPAQET